MHASVRKLLKKAAGFIWVIAVVIVLSASFAITYFILAKNFNITSTKPVPIKKTPVKTVIPDNKLYEFEDKPELKEEEGPRVAIVIDDLGYRMDIPERLLQMDSPISFSILPGLPYSKKIARRAKEFNRDILLHLPMEPINYPLKDPGIGTLFSNMTPEELEKQLIKDLNSIPYIVGTNNHMGSKLTKNENKMRQVMEIIKEMDLFFLDSVTTKKTKAYQIAKEYGIKAAQRNIFLDNVNDLELISEQIIKLGQVALKRGSAIGIGHPGPNTVLALEETIPKLTELGIKIVPVSELVN